MDKLTNLPVESFLPLLLMKHLGSFAKTFEVTPRHLEYGFDPEMMYERQRPASKKKSDLYKEINSEFIEPAEGDDAKAFQIIVDENAINTYLLEMVMVEESIGARSFLKHDPRASEFTKEMTTGNIGLMLPEIIEEYGRDARVDFHLSLSHTLIKDKLEGQRITGFNLDKNGNFRFTFNFYLQMLVEKTKNKNDYEEARTIYMGLTFKGKILV